MRQFTAVTSGEVTITARGPVRDAAERVLGRLWIDQVPVRLASEDTTLWSSAGAAEPLCWPGQPGPARALLPRINELRAQAWDAELTDVILLGSGVPAIAAEMIVRNGPVAPDEPPAGGQPTLTVLDTADPAPLFRIGSDHDRLRHAIVVVSGDDVGTDALWRIFRQMFLGLELPAEDIARRFVVLAEPGSLPAKQAEQEGLTLVPGPTGPVFGALSAHALVAAALAGSDVTRLLDQATAVLPSLTRPENNPGLVLGAILGGAARIGKDTVVLGGYPTTMAGLAEWIAALLVGAGRGDLLPLVQNGGVPVVPDDDLLLITLDGRPRQDDATVSGPLGAQLVMWEYAAAVAAYLLGTDPLRPAVAADRVSPLPEPAGPAALPPGAVHSPGAALPPGGGPPPAIAPPAVTPTAVAPPGIAPPGVASPGLTPPFGDRSFGDPPFGDPSFGDPPFGDPSFGDPPFGDPPFGDPPFGDPSLAGPPPMDAPPPGAQRPGPPGGFPPIEPPMEPPPYAIVTDPPGHTVLDAPLGAPPEAPLSAAHAAQEAVPAAPAGPPPVFSEGPPQFGVDVYADDPGVTARLAGAGSLAAVFDALAESVPADGHMTILPYLDPDPVTGQRRDVQRLASILAARCSRPVTITWRSCYPAFPNDRREKGVYLMLTGNVMQDIPVPDRRYRLGGLQLAQALGEARALRERGRPVVRLHLHNRWTGLAQLSGAAQGKT